MFCRLVGAKPLSEPALNIVNSNLSNKFQWNLTPNSYIFFQENEFENVVCKMAAMLSLSQCVQGKFVSCDRCHISNINNCTCMHSICLSFRLACCAPPVDSVERLWRNMLMFELFMTSQRHCNIDWSFHNPIEATMRKTGSGTNCICVVYIIQSLTWWRHQMEIFSVLLVLCAGNSVVTGDIPA